MWKTTKGTLQFDIPLVQRNHCYRLHTLAKKKSIHIAIRSCSYIFYSKENFPEDPKQLLIQCLEENFNTYTGAVVGTSFLSRFSWQYSDLGASLLDELLQVNLPQLLGQLLQVMLHVLQ